MEYDETKQKSVRRGYGADRLAKLVKLDVHSYGRSKADN